MNWSLRQIANETGLSIYTIRKNYTKNKLELATHVSKGSLRQILLTDLGKKKLLVQCRCSAGVDIAQSNSTENISKYAAKLLTTDNEKLQKENQLLKEELKEEREHLKITLNRHDHIIMSLTQRLEVAQKELPAPVEKIDQNEYVLKQFFEWLNEVPES